MIITGGNTKQIYDSITCTSPFIITFLDKVTLYLVNVIQKMVTSWGVDHDIHNPHFHIFRPPYLSEKLSQKIYIYINLHVRTNELKNYRIKRRLSISK